MTDFLTFLSVALGFALVCVMTVVYLMSKRQITVNQHQENHAAPVTVNSGGESGGLGIAPALIGGAFKLLLAGIALTFVANLIMTGVNGIGQGLQSIGNGLGQQAQPQPIVINYPTAVPQPTAQPLPTAAPAPQSVPAPIQVEAPTDLLTVIVAVLAVAALGLWGYVAVTLMQRRPIKRTNVISQPRPISAREVFGVAPDKQKVKHNVR